MDLPIGLQEITGKNAKCWIFYRKQFILHGKNGDRTRRISLVAIFPEKPIQWFMNCLCIFGTSQSSIFDETYSKIIKELHLSPVAVLFSENLSSQFSWLMRLMLKIWNAQNWLVLTVTLLGPGWCPAHGNRAPVCCCARLGWGTYHGEVEGWVETAFMIIMMIVTTK